MTTKKGKIIIISGPSGVGKTTIISALMQNNKLNLRYSVSMTTRKKRENEVEGINYFFVSDEQFKQAIESDQLLEYEEFVGNKYGTPKQFVLDQLQQGYNILLEIEVKGAKKIIDRYPNEVVSIFILPANFNVVQERLLKRATENEDLINKRLDVAEFELDNAKYYQYKVVNDDLSKAVGEISSIIENATNK